MAEGARARRFGLRRALALLFVVGVGLGRQSQPAGQTSVPPVTPPQPSASAPQDVSQRPPLFLGGANLVRVDVTVLDGRGNPIKTLAADDFEVREDGIPQSVETFRLIEADGNPTDDLSLPIRSPEHAAAEAARDNVRVFLIFWDEYHIGATDSADDARQMLTDFVTRVVGPTDLVAVMDQLTVLDAIRYSRDQGQLADTISWLDGRMGRFFPTRSAVEDEHVRRLDDIRRIRGQVTATAIRAALLHLGSLREGRKTLILVTQGLNDLGGDTDSTVADLVRTANDNNTVIHAIDPARFVGFQPNTLMALTQDTGGTAIGPDDGIKALQRIVREASASYLLGYSPSQNPTDGRFHKITVRVKKPGVQVRARSGYVAPSAKDIARARAMSTAVERTPEISNALAELSAARLDGPIDLWVGAARGPNGPRVTVTWSPKTVSGPGVVPPSVRLVAVGPDGRKYFDGTAEPTRPVAFDAPSGMLTVTATSRNAADEWMGGDTRSIVIPDLSDMRLAVATPVVLRARTLPEAKALLAAPGAPPFAGHEFVRTDRVFIRFEAYGADGATVSAALLNERGTRLVAVPVARLKEMTYQVEVPLASIAPGAYLIAIDATRDGDAAHALVALRVVP